MTTTIYLHSTDFMAQQQPAGDDVHVNVESDDAYELMQIVHLLKAAPVMYDVLCRVDQFMHLLPRDGTDESFDKLLHDIRNAHAAAVGSRPVK